MRTIKFRGKDIETGEWVYGYFVGTTDNVAIIIPLNKVNYDIGYVGDSECCYCFPETIGQFTGLLDKKGNEIYEGDILANEKQPNKCIVKWNIHLAQFQGSWSNMPIIAADIYSMVLLDYKVIGNIHDNPELLKGGKE